MSICSIHLFKWTIRNRLTGLSKSLHLIILCGTIGLKKIVKSIEYVQGLYLITSETIIHFVESIIRKDAAPDGKERRNYNGRLVSISYRIWIMAT